VILRSTATGSSGGPSFPAVLGDPLRWPTVDGPAGKWWTSTAKSQHLGALLQPPKQPLVLDAYTVNPYPLLASFSAGGVGPGGVRRAAQPGRRARTLRGRELWCAEHLVNHSSFALGRGGQPPTIGVAHLLDSDISLLARRHWTLRHAQWTSGLPRSGRQVQLSVASHPLQDEGGSLLLETGGVGDWEQSTILRGMAW
jgi:hypothetical protein